MIRRLLILCSTLTVLVPTSVLHAQSYGEIFKRAKNSVVVLTTEESVGSKDRTRGTRTTLVGQGSGVLISADGKILTAAHVVHLADTIDVQFADGTVVPGKVISSMPQADIALIKVARVPKGAVPADLANSDSVDTGDAVLVIGAPYGLSYSLSSGLISGRIFPDREEVGFTHAEYLQTDAAINKGNSGGPMLDRHGHVIGIVSYILSESGGFEGLGFAVSSNTARRLMLEQRGVWGGLEMKRVEGKLARALNVPGSAGYLVQSVAKGSFADKLGLRGGELETKIGDEKLLLGGDILLRLADIDVSVDDPEEMVWKKLQTFPAGSKVTATVLREGRTVTLSTPWQPFDPQIR